MVSSFTAGSSKEENNGEGWRESTKGKLGHVEAVIFSPRRIALVPPPGSSATLLMLPVPMGG
jgi:hypothetical protein